MSVRSVRPFGKSQTSLPLPEGGGQSAKKEGRKKVGRVLKTVIVRPDYNFFVVYI